GHHNGHGLAAEIREPRSYGQPESIWRRIVDDAYIGVARRHPDQDVTRAISAPIVDDHDFMVDALAFQGRPQHRDHSLQIFGFVACRNDNRKQPRNAGGDPVMRWDALHQLTAAPECVRRSIASWISISIARTS